MKHTAAREIGDRLRAELERLKVMVKEAKARRDPDAEAIEVAIVNLNSAIDILTE